MSIDEERVRARAYQIWEREGRPQGRHQGHWMQALRELAEAEPVEAGPSPGPAAPLPDDAVGEDRAAEIDPDTPAFAAPPAPGMATDVPGDTTSGAGELVLPAAAPLIGGGSRVPSLPENTAKSASKATGAAKSLATRRTAERSQVAKKSVAAARPAARADNSPAAPTAVAKPRRSVRKPRGE